MRYWEEDIIKKLKHRIRLFEGERGLYIGLVCLGAALCLAIGWILPSYNKLKQERVLLDSNQRQVAVLENFKKDKASYDSCLQKVKISEEQLKQVVRTDNNLSELINYVQQQAIKLGVQVREIKQTEGFKSLNVQKRNKYNQCAMQLFLSGEYLALIELLKIFEQEQLNVSEIRLIPDNKDKKVLLEGKIKFYVMDNNNTQEKYKNTR